jgi:uncharacterized protein (DUF1810 family)
MEDPYNLNRFVEAQNPVYSRVCDELRKGRKMSHWMWFIFPQIAGLGFSSMSRRFSITSLDEARAYLDHPVLGPRLIECTKLVCAIPQKTIHEILGSPDDMKFRSCMTLFCQAADQPDLFKDALKRYFSGQLDTLTLERIQGYPPATQD